MAGTGGDTATGGVGGNLAGGAAGSGATAGAGGEGATAGDSSGGRGGGMAGKGGKSDCETLQDAARDALVQAQACSFTVNGRQCTGVVDDLCGCAVPVNDQHSAATAKYLVALAATEGCAIACPAVVCVEPEAATCFRTTAGSATGRCRAASATD
jgi:hypothetical protein